MILGLFSFSFSILELKKLTNERLSSFKTQLKIDFLWRYSGHKKLLEKVTDMKHQ